MLKLGLLHVRGLSTNDSLSKPLWEGDFSAWREAEQNSTGYDNIAIVEKCKKSLLEVKNGSAIYERDSVIFPALQYNWPLLSCLQKIAIDNNRHITVIDIGGSFGTVYFQSKSFLLGVEITWLIVEQPIFVSEGKQYFANQELMFFETLRQAYNFKKPDVILCSGVLQYLEKPYEWIDSIVESGVENLLIDRTAFVARDKPLLTIQNVPRDIYEASYPAWFFNESDFVNYFSPNYTVMADFSSFCDVASIHNGYNIYWKGFFMKKRQ